MRVIRILDPSEDVEEKREKMVEIIKRKGRFRIGKKGNLIFCVKCHEALHSFDDVRYYEQMSRMIIQQKSPETRVVILPMPTIDNWFGKTRSLISDVGPVILTSKAPEQQLMSIKL